MSLIKKIVELADRSDSIDAKKHLVKLSKEVKGYKDKVRSLIEANYVDFIPSVVSNEEVIHEGIILQNEMGLLKENLNNETKNMHSANDQISKLIEDLDETQKALKISLKLVKIDALMHKVKLCNESKKYKEIAHHLDSIEKLIEETDDKIIRRLDCIKSMKHRLTVERCNLKFSLEAEFNGLVQMKEKSFPKTRAVNFGITKRTQELAECIRSLVECDYNFDAFVTFVMTNIFEPVLSRAVSLDIKENDRDYIMSLSYSLEPITDQLRPTYPTVFQNLQEILKLFINMNLINQSERYFLALIFVEQKPKILDLLFDECLKYCIPKTFEEMSKSAIKKDVEKLGEMFTEYNFFESDDGELVTNICQRIDEYFGEQFVKNIQASASDMLKRDLHDMIEISDDSTITTSTPLSFPKSMISKSTLELIKLMENIMQQPESSEKKRNMQESIKNVIENYTFSVQLHHAQLLSKIPQQSALFYNNCNYLGNWVLTNKDLNFSDMGNVVHELKRQGEEFFDCQVAKQKIQLLDILKDFDLSSCLKTIQPEQFKPIRQCLRQLELLKNVWHSILPSELYNNTMGGLVDSISLDIIKKVTAMEDISTVLSNALVDLIKNSDEKCQALFDSDVHLRDLALSWEKLIDLQFILDASLVDIQAAWKDGRLPKNFKTDEVKRLIRALFQNTERRANCLQMIV